MNNAECSKAPFTVDAPVAPATNQGDVSWEYNQFDLDNAARVVLSLAHVGLGNADLANVDAAKLNFRNEDLGGDGPAEDPPPGTPELVEDVSEDTGSDSGAVTPNFSTLGTSQSHHVAYHNPGVVGGPPCLHCNLIANKRYRRN